MNKLNGKLIKIMKEIQNKKKLIIIMIEQIRKNY